MWPSVSSIDKRGGKTDGPFRQSLELDGGPPACTKSPRCYDAAGRLLFQIGGVHAGQVTGQNIVYTYYANGALKTHSDEVAGTLTDCAYA
jgi:hypothetical protein